MSFITAGSGGLLAKSFSSRVFDTIRPSIVAIRKFTIITWVSNPFRDFPTLILARCTDYDA